MINSQIVAIFPKTPTVPMMGKRTFIEKKTKPSIDLRLH